MKEKAKHLRKMLTNAEEIAEAVSLTIVISFALYQAYIHRNDAIEWSALGAAAVFTTIQAFRAWVRVLNK